MDKIEDGRWIDSDRSVENRAGLLCKTGGKDGAVAVKKRVYPCEQRVVSQFEFRLYGKANGRFRAGRSPAMTREC